MKTVDICHISERGFGVIFFPESAGSFSLIQTADTVHF